MAGTKADAKAETNGGGLFSEQGLVEKLNKLNSSAASIQNHQGQAANIQRQIVQDDEKLKSSMDYVGVNHYTFFYMKDPGA